MARRRTIGRDPLSEAKSDEPYSAEIVAIPISGTIPPPGKTSPIPKIDEVSASDERLVVVVNAKARRAVGGRIEFLGGDLGTGIGVIWPLGAEGRLGLVAPRGRTVQLLRELDAVEAQPDRTEHRYLSAIGWAWVLGSVAGIAGLVAAGGLRLLEPKRMIVSVTLNDGTKFVCRTDQVTVSGLQALAAATRHTKG